MVIMDNCSLHFSEVIRDIVEERGAILIYLPPYSPDLNPIETCFSKIQSIMRRRHFEAQRHGVEALYKAMMEITADDMQGYYRRCGVLPPKATPDNSIAEAAAAVLVCLLSVSECGLWFCEFQIE